MHDAEAQPRYDFDLSIVMGFQEVRARSLPPGSSARVHSQEAWRRAYFEGLKQGSIKPYMYQDSSHAQ